MMLRNWIVRVGVVGGAGVLGGTFIAHSAHAGGLLLPGAGVVSTSRAGAGVASADDGEAFALNPAGIAKARGTTITLAASMIDYAMEFQRRGSYDAVDGEAYPYEGAPFNKVKNAAKAPFGIGGFQPIPVATVISDLGGIVPGLHVGIGIFVPNAYPFREMCVELPSGCEEYIFNNNPDLPPPGTRYDIMKQEAAVYLPSLVVAYRVLPELDVGVRLSSGIATVASVTSVWATVGPSYDEDVKKDGVFDVDARDNFVPGFALGATYRPSPNLEFAANYTSKLDIHAKGDATSQIGPNTGVAGIAVQIAALPDDAARCAPGGRETDLKACVDFALPRSVQLAGRYKFLDGAGNLRGDVELDLDWQNWGATCSDGELLSGECVDPGNFRVVVDAGAVIGGTGAQIALNDSVVRHGLRDTYAVRVGGSYVLPIGGTRDVRDRTSNDVDDGGADQIILRGGAGYETAAAKTGWLRADLDGAARTTLTLGAAYRARRFEISAGGGAILEGSPQNPNSNGATEPCNPTSGNPGCGGDEREGPDPINPITNPELQAESPVAQGDYKSHYLLFMLGFSTWF